MQDILPLIPPQTATSQEPPQRRPLLSLSIAAMIIVLAAALFATFATRNHLTPGPQAKPTVPATPIPQAALPDNVSLSDLQMVSPTDGWAVGGIVPPEQATQDRRTFILHYHDGVWVPVAHSIPNGMLNSISMLSPDEGWAVGGIETVQGNDHVEQALVLHYAHSVWTQVDGPATPSSLGQITMISPDEGWVIGHLASSENTIIFHYDHGVWSSQQTGTDAAGLSATSAQNAWVSGYQVMLHWQHGQWVKTQTVDGNPYAIAMVSATDGWAGGLQTVAENVNHVIHLHTKPLLYQYNGSQWNKVALALSADGLISDLQMLSASEGWAVGSQYDVTTTTHRSLMYHFQGGQWQKTNVELPYSLEGLSMSSPDEGWAYGTDEMRHLVLLHYAQGKWTVALH